MRKDVEEVAAALVREYLSRKGLKKTIACMDEELPRTNLSINNRSDLRRILHLESLYKKNKSEEHPLKSMLEIMVKEQMRKSGDAKRCHLVDNRTLSAEENVPGSASTTNDASYMWKDRDLAGQYGDSLSLSESSGAVSQLTASPAKESPSPKSSKSISLCERGIFLPSSSQDSFFASSKVGLGSERKNSDVDVQGSRTSRMRRGIMAGPITTSSQENSRRRPARRTPGSLCLDKPEDDSDRVNWMGQSSSLDAGLTEADGTRPFERASSLSVGSHRQNMDSSEFDGVHRVKLHKNKSACSPRVDGLHMAGLVLDDIDDEEDLPGLSTVLVNNSLPQHNLNKRPMDQQLATALKEIIFGSPMMCFSEEWKRQSFTFSNAPALRYGIVQKKGGPCGVLAAVQATVLQKLLFERTSSDSSSERLRVSDAVRTKCLTEALAEILWRAGDRKKATVAINSGRSLFMPVGHYRSEGVLETITCVDVESLDDLKMLVEQHIQQFESGPFGCILFIVCAILSRTIPMVRRDMDVPTSTLVGAHGYCTQELVNLLLCGRAVSNVFDDEMKLDSGNGNFTLLKGIKERCNIGLLSLFEHYNICKVGSYLKTPRFPLWVVCSESHFSVLFSLYEDLASSPWSPREFDLYYYDGLANQQEPIRLTVYPGSAVKPSDSENMDTDLIPPLELCIRTRWADAAVSWNESEPIL
ncbi:LOW QUALITY PROTEIN: probable ubiquitin carboxyl-terminal hydrolase MINDY-4 [Colossoma macropomum]|uniref:LOW QUALITY PROTEIN: probable ubiquitin carboxyl-terminal hydrolase MINDY-4 n=1 Tax=Colossoma macropomum TaxID=42526 RepID=UPI0018648FFB|nr:LOW QUALITY PROTEIN: probable ubiquitin carboxyl-terminal hydrolase MINDY-4 [Colossoma macropomum]